MKKVVKAARLVCCILVLLLAAAIIIRSAGAEHYISGWEEIAFFAVVMLYLILFFISAPLTSYHEPKYKGYKVIRNIVVILFISALTAQFLSIFKIGIFASFGPWLMFVLLSLVILFYQVRLVPYDKTTEAGNTDGE